MVKVEDQRRFHQIQDQNLKIQKKIKEDRKIRDLHPPGVDTWSHPGCGNTTKVTFSWLSNGIRGSVCPLSSYTLPRLVFTYKYWDFWDCEEGSSREHRLLKECISIIRVSSLVLHFNAPQNTRFFFKIRNKQEKNLDNYVV